MANALLTRITAAQDYLRVTGTCGAYYHLEDEQAVVCAEPANKRHWHGDVPHAPVVRAGAI